MAAAVAAPSVAAAGGREAPQGSASRRLIHPGRRAASAAATRRPHAPKLPSLSQKGSARAAAAAVAAVAAAPAGSLAPEPQWPALQMERVLWLAEDIDARVEELAAVISDDFAGRSVAVIGVATGAFVFLADLIRKISIPVCVDLIRLQSYGNQTESQGVASLVSDIRIDVKGKHVLLVEDIMDTGVTIAALVSHFKAKDAATLSVCCLLDKPERRTVPLQLGDGGNYYRGFECPNAFVVGYGMDFAEEFRSLPYVGVLKPEVYSKA